MAAFEKTLNSPIADLDELNKVLADGQIVKIISAHGQTWFASFTPEEVSATELSARVCVHGLFPRNLEQLADYVDGDTHDQSKVQWFTGSVFVDLLP